MSMRRAFLLDALLGVPACLAGVWVLGHIGVGQNVLLVAAMLAIVIPASGIGLIAGHYERKDLERKERGEPGGDDRGD